MTAITDRLMSLPDARRRAWRAAAATLLAGTFALIAIFGDAALAAWRVWTSSATFNHCLAVVPIAAWLAHRRRAVFVAADPAPVAALPAAAALLGGVAWLVAHAATVYEIQQFALVGILQCLLLGVLGWRAYGALLLPCLYLFFLVPTGEQLVPALQNFTTAFIVAGLDAIGIPNFVDGVFISIPSGSFHVAEACAGLRFLIASLAYGVLYADLTYRSWRRRLLFVALSLAVPILANGIRALGIVLIAHYSNHRYAVGVDHIVYGWGFFLAVTLLLSWIGRRFADGNDTWQPPAWLAPRTPSRPGQRAARLAVVAAGIVVAAGLGPGYAAYLERHGDGRPAHAFELRPAPPWRQETPVADWRPVFRDPAAEWQLRFADGTGRSVDVHVVFYAAQRKGAELLAFANDLQDDRWRRVADARTPIELDGATLQARSRRILAGVERRTVVVAYWVDGRFVATQVEAKLAQVAGTLATGRRAAAAVLLSAEGDDAAVAMRTLQDFARGAQGIGPALAAVAASLR
jgi:exosortase A